MGKIGFLWPVALLVAADQTAKLFSVFVLGRAVWIIPGIVQFGPIRLVYPLLSGPRLMMIFATAAVLYALFRLYIRHGCKNASDGKLLSMALGFVMAGVAGTLITWLFWGGTFHLFGINAFWVDIYTWVPTVIDQWLLLHSLTRIYIALGLVLALIHIASHRIRRQ